MTSTSTSSCIHVYNISRLYKLPTLVNKRDDCITVSRIVVKFTKVPLMCFTGYKGKICHLQQFKYYHNSEAPAIFIYMDEGDYAFLCTMFKENKMYHESKEQPNCDIRKPACNHKSAIYNLHGKREKVNNTQVKLLGENVSTFHWYPF